MDIAEKSRWIKDLATHMGFTQCGIATAMPLYEDAYRLENWLNKGFHGSMTYMERNFDLRIDPTKLVPGAKSVITLLYNYFPKEVAQNPDAKISKYAYGVDYHYVIREKLNNFLAQVRAQFGQIEGRGFVDSAPVLERTWAVKSGLGWIGKNGNLIHKKAGSFFFLSTLITDLALKPDTPFATDHCGSCTKCIDACPTQAILPDKTVVGNKCISYLTIELKDEIIPNDLQSKMDNWLFGCDVCQDVCPWNRFSTPNKETHFEASDAIMTFSLKDWEEINEQSFKILFKNSPIARTKWKGIQRNVAAIKKISI